MFLYHNAPSFGSNTRLGPLLALFVLKDLESSLIYLAKTLFGKGNPMLYPGTRK